MVTLGLVGLTEEVLKIGWDIGDQLSATKVFHMPDMLKRRGRILFVFCLNRGQCDKSFHIHRGGEGRVFRFLGVLAGVTRWGSRGTLSRDSAAFGRGRSPQACHV